MGIRVNDGQREMMVMRRDFSEASLPERKVGLWTPWGVVRLDTRDARTDDARRLAPPPPCVGDRRAELHLTQQDFDPRA